MDKPASDSAKTPETVRYELVRSFTRFERSFRKNFPLLWMLTLVGPAILTAIILILLGISNGWDYPSKILWHAVLTFFIFGRFVVILGTPDSGGDAQGYDITMEPWELFTMVTYMDVMVALFVTVHMGIVFRLPWVGEKIATMVSDGKFIMESHPWIRRVAFLGLVLFVIFPTSTTGSIGGSIFGRLLGLSRWLTVTGVMLGSLLGNAIMYAFAKQLNHYVDPRNMWFKVAGVLIIVGVLVLFELRYQRVKKKYFAQAEKDKKNDESESA